MACAVLRCTNEVTDVVNMPRREARREVALCAEHAASFHAGEPYFFDAQERAVLMGDDLQAASQRRLTGADLLLNGDRVSGVEGTFGRVRIEHTAIDGTDHDFLDLLLTPDQAGQLIDLLKSLRDASW